MSLGNALRDFSGRIIGYIEDKSDGDQIGRDFYGKIVGYWDKKLNVTRDYYQRIVGRGNMLSSLIQQAEDNYRKKK